MVSNTGYFLLWDEASNLVMVYCTKDKSGASQLHAFQKYEAFLKSHGHRVWMVQCDGGGEYLNQNTLDYWSSIGLDGESIQPSCPHTPQQNGRAERMILTIDDKCNAQLQHMQLSDVYWEQSLLYVCHVENRIITAMHPTHTHQCNTSLVCQLATHILSALLEQLHMC